MARLTGEASLVEQINVMAATICPQVIMLVTSRVITMMNMTMRMRMIKNIRDGVELRNKLITLLTLHTLLALLSAYTAYKVAYIKAYIHYSIAIG